MQGRLVAAAAATTRRGEDSGERSVLVQAIEQGEDDGQAAAAQNAVAETPVFRAQNEQSNENPRGGITLCAAIHIKNLLCFHRRGYVKSTPKGDEIPAVLSFYYIVLPGGKKCSVFSVHFVARKRKMRYNK